MDLFGNAGIDTHIAGGRRVVPRTQRIPLFSHKVVAAARKRFTFDPSARQRSAAIEYAKTASSARFNKQKETAVRQLFFEKVLGEILGYSQIAAEGEHTLAFEFPIRRGAVDAALGHFGLADGSNKLSAPFELKGPGTADLDAIMPGRGRSPVQQAWDYAVDAPGSKWVLVSNCVEVRLYGFGRGRDAYELFDLRRLEDEEEHARLCMLLSAPRFLGGPTDELLRESENAYKDVTGKLYESYKSLRDRLISFVTDDDEGPRLPLISAIEVAQKILDRILFIAFAQRTDLLPDRLLKGAAEEINRYVPKPLWHNFQGLFDAVNKGSTHLNIWGYNGGLFAADPIADSLIIPDPLATDLASLGEWDYRSEVPVTVLGHIFEQSITDIERLRALARGEAAPKISKTKRQGVVYTPEVVTRFLVERTIDVTLEEKFGELLKKHGKPVTSRSTPDTIFSSDETGQEKAFWRDYLETLRNFTIIDPACGSGAFLVAAFDLLAREYRGVVELLATLGETVDFDPYDEIVTKNLFGVDINAESVEITRLALWLKTARSKHRLQNLEATIKFGDSIIESAEWTERPFNWRERFSNVFAKGGFDVVIGNPPYVRMELIKPFKPYLKDHYVVYDGSVDLYAYFFEQGVRLLKDNGRLGFVSSSTFFRTGSGENLRRFLNDKVSIESIVDFGDLQLFEGVTTYPATITLRKSVEGLSDNLSFMKLEVPPTDLGAAFQDQGQPMPRARLGAGSWQLENDSSASLRSKLKGSHPTLLEVGKRPMYGAKTGANDVFIITKATRDAMVASDKNSVDLLKPLLTGDDLHRWGFTFAETFLVFTNGGIDLNKYPAVNSYLEGFRDQLEPKPDDWIPASDGEKWLGRKAGSYKWYELQDTVSYFKEFESSKVIYPEFSQGPKFSVDTAGNYLTNKCFIIAGDFADAAYLNSKAIWFFLFGEAAQMRGGQWRLELRTQYVEKIPFALKSAQDRKPLFSLGKKCSESAAKRDAIIQAACHRIKTDLAGSDTKALSPRLREFWKHNFSEFRTEVKKALKHEIALKHRDEWEAFISEKSKEVIQLSDDILKAEKEIDACVYRLFSLSSDEISILEESIAGQY